MIKDTFDLQNPWRNPLYTIPEEPWVERSIFKQLFADLDAGHITIVVGSRQVGKTFLIKRLVRELVARHHVDRNQLFYFNFDSFELIELVRNKRNFLDFLESYGVPGKHSFVFLDEAQRISEIGLLLKEYHDLELPIKFVVSGSSSLQIKSQIKETLTGRKRVFELFPITFEEFLRFSGVAFLPSLETSMRFEAESYQHLLEQFVLYGGYPGVVMKKSREEKINLLKEIYRSYVQKDISDFLKIEDIPGFNRLVQYMSAQTGGLCKVNEVSKNVRLSRYFVEKYLFALEETYILSTLRPYFVNLGKAIVKTPKYYFCDTGIRNAVFGQFDALEARRDTGILIENFVFNELIKAVDKERLWFYRTTTGAEVDFLYIAGERATPIEIKYSRARQDSVPKVFRTIHRYHAFPRGIVVTKDSLREYDDNGMHIVFQPAWSTFSLARRFSGKDPEE
jgi:hypothetical protein